MILDLKISNVEGIKLKSPTNIVKIDYYTEVNVYYYHEQTEFKIFSWNLYGLINDLENILQEVLSGNSVIPVSLLDKGLGYYYNLDNEKFLSTNAKKGDNVVCIRNFESYGIWLREFFTWFYIANNEIYLEISPAYEWHFKEPGNVDKFKSFEEWINNYEFIVKRKLDKKVITNWLNMCKEVRTKAVNVFPHDNKFNTE